MDGSKKCGLICLLIVLVISSILLACSFDTIEPTQWGLNYSAASKTIEIDQVYGPGRFFLGLGHSFIRFPSTYQTIEFSEEPGATRGPLSTRSSEGLAITVQCAFQYRLQKDNLDDLYLEFRQGYTDAYIRQARDIILKVVSGFDRNALYTAKGRRMIADGTLFPNGTRGDDGIRGRLVKDLNRSYADVLYVQIFNIYFSNDIEHAIEQTQVAEQDVKRQGFLRDTREIEKQQELIMAEADRNVAVINATAHAQSFNITQEARAAASNRLITAQAEAYGKAQDVLGLESATDVNSYIWLQTVEDKKDAKSVLVGVVSEPTVDVAEL